MSLLSPNFTSPEVYPEETEDFDFNYDLESCYLAPRGIHAQDEFLFVADTAQNRIFCRRLDRDGNPDEQSLFFLQNVSTDPKAPAARMRYPSGVCSDGTSLAVADAWNHRVLIWNEIPANGERPPDAIVGQPNPHSGEINVDGQINAPKPNSLYWPYGVHLSDGKLWIADTGNRRILFYDRVPNRDGVAADAVYGQRDFHSRDYAKDHFVWPYSVKISPRGEMLVADTSCFRVVYWKNHRDAAEQPFLAALGQKNRENSLQNHGLTKASATGMNWCYDAIFFKEGLLAADTGNSRILQWNRIPETHGQAADSLIGQKSFEASAENSSVFKRRKDNFYWPFSISLNRSHLWVSDTGNNRIIRYELRENPA